jgi:hypothetical protein
MAASPSVATFSLTLRQRAYYFARGEVKSESRRSKIRQVSRINCSPVELDWWCISDMPEKEATYIITNGGINDPEKV